MIVDEFLKDLSEEIGFKLGSPWRYSDKSLGVIVPILRERYNEERGYITLEEAKDKGVTFKDIGRINRVVIESSLGIPIFIRSGTALKGIGTQPRAVETSIVVVPEAPEISEKKNEQEIHIPIIKQEIPVRCIHASMPISSGNRFSYAGDVPLEVRTTLMSKSGQAQTWAAVGHATNRFMASSSLRHQSSSRLVRIQSDNLVGVMEEVDKFQSNVDEVLKKIPLFEDQIGAIFLDMKDVVGMELFDHPKSWEAIHKEVEKRLGESMSKEEDKSFFKPDYERVKPLTFAFLKKLLESKKTEISKNSIVSTISLKGDGIIGEATTINGKVIHLVGIKSDKSPESETVKGTVSTDRIVQEHIRNITSNVRTRSTAAHGSTSFDIPRASNKIPKKDKTLGVEKVYG